MSQQSNVPGANVIRASVLRGFEKFLEGRGVPARPLLTHFGLNGPQNGDFERELPFDRVAQLMEHAAIACADQNFGFAYAKAYPVGGMGLIAFLFLNSRTVEDAMRTLVRFVPLLKIPFKFAFERTSDGACVTWRPTDEVSRDYKQIYAFGAALLMFRLRSLLPPGWQPMRVDLQSCKPNDISEIEGIFGPNVVYSASCNSIWVDEETLRLPVPRATPELRDVLERLGEKEIAGLLTPNDRVVEMTRQSILKLMGERRITLEDVASGMQFSPRTLQSRLASNSTTFEDVLNDARKARAEQLMKSPHLSLTEIAHQLGFSELSAFTRAAQRWFGRTPSAQRQILKTNLH